MLRTYSNNVRLCLVSRSLRCLQLGMSSLGDIRVVDAPRLERFFLVDTNRPEGNKFSRIKIGNAPNLRMLGYLPPGLHELQIGNTIIEAGTMVSPSTIVPSVKILALQVHFEVCDEAETVPSILKCFPNVETLHIQSVKVNKPTGKVNLKFWQEACPAECVQHVKKLVIHGFQGKKNEHAFIKFIGETAQALEKMVVMVCFETTTGFDAKMMPFATVKWASKFMDKIYFKVPPPHFQTPWSFRKAADVSCTDPFDLASAV
ncbi:unnamed protein product [Urochloa humidicola]